MGATGVQEWEGSCFFGSENALWPRSSPQRWASVLGEIRGALGTAWHWRGRACPHFLWVSLTGTGLTAWSSSLS